MGKNEHGTPPALSIRLDGLRPAFAGFPRSRRPPVRFCFPQWFYRPPKDKMLRK